MLKGTDSFWKNSFHPDNIFDKLIWIGFKVKDITTPISGPLDWSNQSVVILNLGICSKSRKSSEVKSYILSEPYSITDQTNTAGKVFKSKCP